MTILKANEVKKKAVTEVANPESMLCEMAMKRRNIQL